MTVRLITAPAGAGKTHACLERVRSVLKQTPMAQVWVVLPDRNQANAFSRRLARAGGALGVQVGIFQDLYLEVLALAGKSVPLAPEPLVHRLTRAAIDKLAENNQLHHYLPITWRPGFTQAVSDLFAELKRGLVPPEQFTESAQGYGARLEELAAIYAEYQSSLQTLEWADTEGLGWLAVQSLEQDEGIASDWRLLVADGFDSFNRVSLKALTLLSGRVGELCLTLSGDLEMARPAYRRFQRTLVEIRNAIAPEIETLTAQVNPQPVLAHLQASLFESNAVKLDPGYSITWMQAQTPRLEAREALRWLKMRIKRDGVPPDGCAVIARDLIQYRPFLAEAAGEFGMPLRFLGGEPLVNNPVIAAILNLLSLAAQGWLRRPLLDAVRTPYFDLSRFGLSAADAAHLDRVARYGQVVEGIKQWRDVLIALSALEPEPSTESEDDAKLPELPKGALARRLLVGLEGLVESATPPKEESVEGFVDWVQALLFGEDGLAVLERAQAQKDTEARDLSALAALGETLQSLVLSERIVGARAKVPYDEFLVELLGTIETTTYNPTDPRTWQQARIYAGNLNTTRGISYRAVAVLGLSEGIFPAPVMEDPLLSDEERERLRGQGLPLEPRARSDQQTLFYEAATRAGEFLLFTRPYLADDGEKWEPSPYWNATLALFDTPPPPHIRPGDARPLADAGSTVELLASAMRAGELPAAFAGLRPEWESVNYAGAVLRARLAHEARGGFEGQVDGLAGVLQKRYGAEHIWSASRLEKYGICPFYFYNDSALGLELIEPPELGYDAAQLGSMLHKILEHVYQRVSDPTNLELLLAELPAVADEVFNAAPGDYGFRPTPLWEMQRKELKEALANTLAALDEASDGFGPILFEQKFGYGTTPLTLQAANGAIYLRGMIDRVDRNKAGELRIIDYKTGASGFSKDELVEGRRLQLPLYALAAEESLRLGRVVDGFYWGILKGAKSSLRLKTFKHESEEGEELFGPKWAIEVAMQHVEEDVRRIREGQFVPTAPAKGCPKYCPAKIFCWRYVPSEA